MYNEAVNKYFNNLYRNFHDFMQHEGSFSCSEQPAISSCPEQDESATQARIYFFSNHFNIIVPFMLRSSRLCFVLIFLTQLCMHFYLMIITLPTQ
jgi:hypothetical protein